MKIVMLGNYPAYQYSKELRLKKSDIRRVTSWNKTLTEGLAHYSNVEIYFITKGPVTLKKTTIINRNNLHLIYLVVPRIINGLTLTHYLGMIAKNIIEEINPEIVHGIGTEHIWPFVAIKSKFPSVITVHGIMNEIVQKVSTPILSRKRYFLFLERYVLKKTENLISISPYVEESLGKYTKAKIYYVENAVSTLFFKGRSDPQKSSQILFVGDTSERKNLLTLLKAIKLIKDDIKKSNFKIKIIGPLVGGSYQKKIFKFIKDNNLINFVDFAGFILPQELAMEYKKSAFLVLTSIEETAPMCIAEAMASGIPVVASNISGIPYMVEHKKTGFLFSRANIDELARYLRLLINDSTLIKNMGREALIIARNRWRQEIIAKKTMDVYRKIVNNVK